MRSLDKVYKIESRRKILPLFFRTSMLRNSEIMKHNFMKTHVGWSTPKDVRGINFGRIWKCKPLSVHEAVISIVLFLIE
jgi:hypothetical protein